MAVSQPIVAQDGQTTIYRIETAVPAGAGPFPYTVDLPPGVYRLSIFIACQLTGTTTQLQALPFVDKGQVTVGSNMSFVEIGNTAPSATPSLPAAKAGRAYFLLLNPGNTATPYTDAALMLAYGLKFIISKGTSVSGEQLVFDLFVSRVDKILSVNPAV